MKALKCVLVLALLSFVGVSAVAQEVNCKQVRRYAETGRTAEDISMTMVIDVELVRKCLESDNQEAKPTPAEKQ